MGELCLMDLVLQFPQQAQNFHFFLFLVGALSRVWRLLGFLGGLLGLVGGLGAETLLKHLEIGRG